MRAAVLHGVGDLRVEDVPEPELRAGHVLIDVAYNGICGSDLGIIGAFDAARAPHPLTGACGPQILGHEFSGTVRELGPDVDGITVGDRVVVQPTYRCGTCPRCRDGLDHLCAHTAFHGINAPGGGLAERTAVPAGSVHVLPDTVTLEQGALVEPLAVALHAVALSGIEPGQSALIVGAGPIGIATALNLRAGGVDRILLSETSESRRVVAAALGFDVIDPNTTDPVAAVHDRTDGSGADTVFECAGAAVAVATVLRAVRARGVVVLLATYRQPIPLDPYTMMFGEMRVMSSLTYTRNEFRTVIDRMATGIYPLDGWTSRIPLADIVDGVRQASDGTRTKILVEVPHG
ncbi:2,3-butanediol dehydrogenase [Prescottella subtropica]|uniref:2,3-butanediol dehydrogenase n=1 Tax=Prescottella subtropica TaxID=2545757 RepID=UPI0010F503DD|nr:2,3-butanediol dehydrogenase [Prescottella subtropica]